MASLMTIVKLFCMAMVARSLVSAKPLRKGSESDPEDLAEIVRRDYECENAENKTECQLIMNNSYLQHSYSILKRMAHAEIQESVARSKRSASCPDYNGDYLNNASLPQGLRSLSPFETHTTFDPLRTPKLLTNATCLCRGCIHPVDLTETHNLNSEPITVHITVHRAGRRFKQSITVGCTCVIPKRNPRLG